MRFVSSRSLVSRFVMEYVMVRMCNGDGSDRDARSGSRFPRYFEPRRLYRSPSVIRCHNERAINRVYICGFVVRVPRATKTGKKRTGFIKRGGGEEKESPTFKDAGDERKTENEGGNVVQVAGSKRPRNPTALYTSIRLFGL